MYREPPIEKIKRTFRQLTQRINNDSFSNSVLINDIVKVEAPPIVDKALK